MHRSQAGDADLANLLAASAAGDQTAFASLYDRTSGQVYGLVLRILNDRSHAEEVVQEAYLHYWQQADHYRPALGTVRNWMLTIAHRRSVDRIRSEELYRKRGSEYADAEAAVPPTPVVEIVEGRDQSRTLRRCLDHLTNLQRDSIELSYFSGMTYPQVAERMSTPLPTIKSRIRDGLRSLRNCVKTGGS